MDNRNKYSRKEVRKEKEMKDKKCPYCGNRMKCKGIKDVVGTIYWICRNKNCGRTVNFRRPAPKEVIPLTYVDIMKR